MNQRHGQADAIDHVADGAATIKNGIAVRQSRDSCLSQP
jgi:hypothetical protein